MGLFGDRMKDPVRGEGYVVSCWDKPEAEKGDCRVTLTVRAEGVSSRTVEVSEKNVKRDQWPRSGQTLPITVDREDPEKVKVEWDQVSSVAAPSTATTVTTTPATTSTDSAMEDQLEKAFPGSEVHVETQTQSFTPQAYPLMGGNLTDQIKQAMEMAQQVQQQYAAGAFQMPTPQAPQVPQKSGEDQIIADLERLAKLKADGVLTEAEFEAQKKKILGGG